MITHKNCDCANLSLLLVIFHQEKEPSSSFALFNPTLFDGKYFQRWESSDVELLWNICLHHLVDYSTFKGRRWFFVENGRHKFSSNKHKRPRFVALWAGLAFKTLIEHGNDKQCILTRCFTVSQFSYKTSTNLDFPLNWNSENISFQSNSQW